MSVVMVTVHNAPTCAEEQAGLGTGFNRVDVAEWVSQDDSGVKY